MCFLVPVRTSFPLAMASSIFMVYVLPSVSWGTEFFSHSPPALRLLDHALRRWGRFLLGWPSGSPSAGVLAELGWPDAERLSTGRLLSLSGRACAFPSGPRCPLPGTVFHIAAGLAGSWAHHAQELCLSVGAVMPHMCGVVPGCLPSLARRWFDSQVRPSLDSAFFHRVVGSASSLSVVHFPLSTLVVGVGPDSRVYGRATSPTHARLWDLARWGHNPFPGGRSARHNHLPLGCPFCLDPVGDLFHCLCVCPAFDDLRAQWYQRSGVPVQSAPEWCRHPWLFDTSSNLNSSGSIRAHVRFVGEASERFLRLSSR